MRNIVILGACVVAMLSSDAMGHGSHRDMHGVTICHANPNGWVHPNTKSKSHCSTPKAKYCSDSRQQLAERQARRPANANQAFQQQSRIRILKWPVEACDVLSDSTAEEQEREAAPIRERARKDCYAICTATKCGEKIMTRKTGCGSKPCYSRPHLLLIGAPIRRRSAL